MQLWEALFEELLLLGGHALTTSSGGTGCDMGQSVMEYLPP